MYVVAANTPADPKDVTVSHGQSRIIQPDGNIVKEATFFGEAILTATLSIQPRRLERPLTGPLGDWWRKGVDIMMRDRHRQLE
jgi:predicted amidohydrolase